MEAKKASHTQAAPTPFIVWNAPSCALSEEGGGELGESWGREGGKKE